MVVLVPTQKVQVIANIATALLAKHSVSLRQVAQVLGLIENARGAMRIAAAHYRALQQQLNHSLVHHSWDHKISLNQEAQTDLLWWIHQAPVFNGRPLQVQPSDMIIQSDASQEGWGGVCVNHTVQGRWTQEEKKRHINVLEIQAAKLVLQSFLHNQSNLTATLQLDNTVAVAYLKNEGGAKSPELCTIALQIWQLCENKNIHLKVEHVPGTMNVLADKQSRVFQDHHDYQLNPRVFQQICLQFHQPEIDMFASHTTRQLNLYVSWTVDPQATAVNAFSLTWTDRDMYMFPPPPLITRCLQKIRRDKAKAIMVKETLVSTVTSDVQSVSTSVAKVQRVNSRTTHREATQNKSYTTSRLDAIRRHYRGQGISAKATEILVKAVRQSTSKQYDFKWTRFASWCSQRNVDPVSCPAAIILEFLTELFQDKNLTYSTLNGYRAAISSAHLNVYGKPIGSHPLVVNLFRGFFHIRPPTPRYPVTWDVTGVLNYLKSLHPSSSLSLKQLTLKTVMLIALTSSDRGQTIANLDIKFCNITDNFVLFVVPKLTKTSSVTKPYKTVNRYTERNDKDLKICLD
ncbi:uncharacterized protein [Ptychodera flava]|uniref:uncharacterized protein n=1 Tax=Ptychodera flava TaxID=63121 RepID=UPI003969CC57